MIKITNGSRETTVTKGAFHEIYEPMGWKIADLSEEKVEIEDLPEEDEKHAEIANEAPKMVTEEEPYESEEDEVEIPLSEMKLSELKAYAKEHGIDISVARTKQDIKDIIRAEMEG